MAYRRRQEAPLSDPSNLVERRAPPAGSVLFRLLNGTNQDGSTKQHTTARRILLLLSPFLALSVLLWLGSGTSDSTSSYGRGQSLPGFGSRSQFAASRRTDAQLRTARKNRAQAQLQGGTGGGFGPANFSESAPFTFCPTFGSGDELGGVYGSEALLKTRAHVGSSERVKKVIKRAMAGLPVTIGVIGGSVSSCHGLDANQAHPLGNPIGPNCYPHRIFSWLNDVFPHPANELTNGARK